MKIFIDTSAFYALCSVTDLDHNEAVACFENIIRNQGILFTSNYVMLETISLIQRRHGFEAAEAFYKGTAGNIEILWVGSEQHSNACRFWEEKRERNLSFVDCTSFILMQETKLKEAFCFDDHFKREGFATIP